MSLLEGWHIPLSDACGEEYLGSLYNNQLKAKQVNSGVGSGGGGLAPPITWHSYVILWQLFQADKKKHTKLQDPSKKIAHRGDNNPPNPWPNSNPGCAYGPPKTKLLPTPLVKLHRFYLWWLFHFSSWRPTHSLFQDIHGGVLQESLGGLYSNNYSLAKSQTIIYQRWLVFPDARVLQRIPSDLSGRLENSS